MNAAIERAYREKKLFINLDLEDGTIRIDLAKMVEIDVAGGKPDVELHRADLKAGTILHNSGLLMCYWHKRANS